MKTAPRFYCATTKKAPIMLCLIHCTALPWSLPLLKCLAQLCSCPPWLPAPSAISHIPNPNTLSQGNYSAGMTPTSILYQRFPLVCFTGNDGIKNVFGLERLVQHQPTTWPWQVTFPRLVENRHKRDLGWCSVPYWRKTQHQWPHLGPVPAAAAPRVPAAPAANLQRDMTNTGSVPPAPGHTKPHCSSLGF